uniref:PIG-L family deacetylase n=1 Tax=candidate division CPR3 bacterium TaxID=2268181 RepID=A0A7C4M0H7_UNCC3
MSKKVFKKGFLFFLSSTKSLARFLLKYKKIVITGVIFYTITSFGLGFIGGYFLTKGGLFEFDEITSNEKILIIAPHIDDEVICTGGVIQEAIKKEAEVKIVFLTNGDDAISSMISDRKKLEPNEFISLGQQRMQEGKSSANVLGLNQDSLIFLGYPDGGLYSMLNTNFNQDNPHVSRSTKFSYNPYQGTYKEKQKYTGEGLVDDLNGIIDDFQPTIIFVPHIRDKHSDHRAAYLFLEKVIEGKDEDSYRIFSYLVHYKFYPPEKKFLPAYFMYPPKSLFSQEGWYSFDLSDDQQNKKEKAIYENYSQTKQVSIGSLRNFLLSFVRRNEIFEKIEF